MAAVCYNPLMLKDLEGDRIFTSTSNHTSVRL